LAAADGAEAVLDSLQLTLATDVDGAPVTTRRIALLQGDPPHLRIDW